MNNQGLYTQNIHSAATATDVESEAATQVLTPTTPPRSRSPTPRSPTPPTPPPRPTPTSPPRLIRETSRMYRQSSQSDQQTAIDWEESNRIRAEEVAVENGVTFDQALRILAPRFDSWDMVPLEDDDTTLGTVLTSEQVSICCSSRLDGFPPIYNDTLGLVVPASSANPSSPNPSSSSANTWNMFSPSAYHAYSAATYRTQSDSSGTCSHGGDHMTTQGWLRHNMMFNRERDTPVGTKIYIISAPWVNGRSARVQELVSTRPVLEIRTTATDGTRRRHIIAQDLSDGEDSTAFLNAVITKLDDGWSIKVCGDFLSRGYADNIGELYQAIVERERSFVSVAGG